MQHYPPVKEQAGKQEQVARMFDAVAPRYDLVNRIVSMGQDQRWRRYAIRQLGALEGSRVLDLATGTGDIALRLARKNPAEVVGVDISPVMLSHARSKVDETADAERLRFTEGSAEALPFDSDLFDAAIVAFGVRNFENLHQGLVEINRVLRPNAPLVVLEFSQPSSAIVRWSYRAYSRWVIPTVGRLLSGVRGAYQYLPDSIEAFPSGKDFLLRMQQAGFVQTRSRPLSLGLVTVYYGQRSD